MKTTSHRFDDGHFVLLPVTAWLHTAILNIATMILNIATMVLNIATMILNIATMILNIATMILNIATMILNTATMVLNTQVAATLLRVQVAARLRVTADLLHVQLLFHLFLWFLLSQFITTVQIKMTNVLSCLSDYFNAKIGWMSNMHKGTL